MQSIPKLCEIHQTGDVPDDQAGPGSLIHQDPQGCQEEVPSPKLINNTEGHGSVTDRCDRPGQGADRSSDQGPKRVRNWLSLPGLLTNTLISRKRKPNSTHARTPIPRRYIKAKRCTNVDKDTLERPEPSSSQAVWELDLTSPDIVDIEQGYRYISRTWVNRRVKRSHIDVVNDRGLDECVCLEGDYNGNNGKYCQVIRDLCGLDDEDILDPLNLDGTYLDDHTNDITLGQEDWKVIVMQFEKNLESLSDEKSCRLPRNKIGSLKVKFDFSNSRMKSHRRARNDFVHNMLREGSPHATAKHWKFAS